MIHAKCRSDVLQDANGLDYHLKTLETDINAKNSSFIS